MHRSLAKPPIEQVRDWDTDRAYPCDGDPVHCPNDSTGLYVKRFGPQENDITLHTFCNKHAPEGVDPVKELHPEKDPRRNNE